MVRITEKQKKLAEMIIENSTLDKPLNKGEMLEKVGYAKSVAEAKASDIIESEGVQTALTQSGFTEENAKKVVESIMLDPTKDPNSRLKASDMVFKVHGSYAPDKSINVNIDTHSIDPTDPEVLEALKVINKQRANGQRD
jgi:hypothetical protein